MNRKGYWLGFFFFVVLLTLVFASLTVSQISFAKPYFYWVHFKAVEGLKIGDDVRLEGVVMGKVDEMKLDERSGVDVKLRMNRELKLLLESEIYIETLSIIGGNFISITRGQGAGPMDMAQTLSGKTRPNALTDLGEAVEENRKTLKEVMTNVRDTFAETKTLVANINAGQGTIGKLATETALYDDARKTLSQLQDVAAKINEGQGTIAKLINSSEIHDELKSTMDQLSKAAEKINSGEGLVGRALNDKKIADDFADTVEKLKVISTNLEQVTGKVARGEGTVGKLIQEEKIVDDIQRQLDNVEKTLGRAARSKLFVGADYRPYFDTDVTVSRLYIRIEPDATKYFQMGGSFIGLDAEGDTVKFKEQVEKGKDDTIIKFDLQAMYKIPWFFDNHVGLRAGLIDGKPGGGLDLDFEILDHEFFLTLEARDAYGHVEDEDIDEEIHGPMSRVWMRTPLWNKNPTAWYEQILYAMKAVVGVSRLQDEPELFAGIGFEYTDEDLRTLVSLISTAK